MNSYKRKSNYFVVKNYRWMNKSKYLLIRITKKSRNWIRWRNSYNGS